MEKEIRIDNKVISEDSPTFIVAEMSGNHNMDFDRAVEIMKAAKEAGADAVKIQTYTADTITLDCDDPCFQITQGTLWDGVTLHKLYQTAYTPWEWQPRLKRMAEDMGLLLFPRHLILPVWIFWRIWMYRRTRSHPLRLRIYL